MIHNYTPKCITKRNENICPRKNWYMNVHSSFIHNSPKVETTQVVVSWQEDVWGVVCPYNGILFSREETGVLVHAATRKDLGDMLGEGGQSRVHVLYDSVCVNYPEWAGPWRQRVDWWLPGPGQEREMGRGC